MSHESFDSQAAAYALGVLDAGERAEFEAHLHAGCPRCEATLRESAEALAFVAGQAPPAVPPPEVKARLVRRLDVASDKRRLQRTWLRWAVTSAAAMLVGGVLVGGWVAARYEARLGQAARELAALRQRMVAEREVIELLRDPATRVVVLAGLEAAPKARGRVVWSEATGGQLVVSDLPPAPAGKAYELWTIRGGAPRPAGVFQVDRAGEAVVSIPKVEGGVDVFAVTLEPAAGVPSPTGPMVLASR